jgi:type IV pilus assembly protein PilB
MPATAEIGASQPLLIRLLLEADVVSLAQIDELQLAKNPPKDQAALRSLLVTNGLATDEQIAKAYADYLMMPLLDSAPPMVDTMLADRLPEKLCRENCFTPVQVSDDVLDIAFTSIEDTMMVDELQLLTGMNVRPMIAPATVVRAILDVLYRAAGAKFVSAGASYPGEDEGASNLDVQNEEILDIGQVAPAGPDGRIIRLVNQVLEQTLRVGASDIHLEPFEDSCNIRLRVDGSLRELIKLPRSQFVSIISRFKILGKMDIAEKRVPQDGAIALVHQEKRIDLRVNTVPTVYGEKMVMRVLDKGAIPIELTGLGFDERQSKDLVESIEMPHGLMLVTGPTGSGKSTTLYACLNRLNTPDTNICTVEDPVEYKFTGINQVQVKTQVGLTFASALRAFLRQDPDVIMVGEVRDQETAGICLRAALTGHFVLSTIHTNDSLSAVNRLVDMGLEPFLLASTLRVLEAQRLIRRLCKECKEPFDCDAETAERYGFEVGQKLYRPKGCDTCRGAGYKGRVGIFEVVRITSRIANLIQSRASVTELRTAACEEGMKMLVHSGLDKVRMGLTSLEEVLSVAMSGED